MRKPHLFGLIFLFLTAAYNPGRAQDSTLSYLALGDSYTIGENVDTSERWPEQLVEQLREKGIQIHKPKIIAKTGWTTGELDKAVEKARVNPPYDLVSVLIGVNDQYQGLPVTYFPYYFSDLLKKAIALAGDAPQNVVVLSIPDYGVTPFGQQRNPTKIARELDEYNAINKTISDSLGVHYVDITPASRNVTKDASLVADDGLHPSGRMYRQWVEKALPVVLKILKP